MRAVSPSMLSVAVSLLSFNAMPSLMRLTNSFSIVTSIPGAPNARQNQNQLQLQLQSKAQQQRQVKLCFLLDMNADSWNVPSYSQASSSGGVGSSGSGTSSGSIETIEFKIYPDGRVEETVRGVKGNNCHKVTESINEALGSVIASKPTEEMYENEIIVTETISLTNTNNNEGGSSAGWEGSSSW